MFDSCTPVGVRSAGRSRVVRSHASIGRSTACSLWPTNGCAGCLRVCSPRRSGVAASSSWQASRVCTVTPLRKASASCGRNADCRPVGCVVPALDAGTWKKNARGAHGLARAFARCDRRRSDHRHEMDPSLAAKTLQGLASSWCEVVSHDARSLVATAALLAANVS